MKTLRRAIYNFIKRQKIKRRCKKAHIKYVKGCYVGKNVKNYGANISLSDKTVICDDVVFWGCGNIKIGSNTSIGFRSSLCSGNDGGVTIGNNVIIGPNLCLNDSDHKFDKDELINKQPMIAKPITIEDDVWIGSNVTILKGTTIKSHSVVGACSLCNKVYEGHSLLVGIPASKKKTI